MTEELVSTFEGKQAKSKAFFFHILYWVCHQKVLLTFKSLPKIIWTRKSLTSVLSSLHSGWFQIQSCCRARSVVTLTYTINYKVVIDNCRLPKNSMSLGTVHTGMCKNSFVGLKSHDRNFNSFFHIYNSITYSLQYLLSIYTVVGTILATTRDVVQCKRNPCSKEV